MEGYLNCHTSPPRTNFKQSITRAKACLFEDSMNLPVLRCLEIPRLRTVNEVAAHTTLFFAPNGTGIHHLLAEECLRCTVRKRKHGAEVALSKPDRAYSKYRTQPPENIEVSIKAIMTRGHAD